MRKTGTQTDRQKQTVRQTGRPRVEQTSRQRDGKKRKVCVCVWGGGYYFSKCLPGLYFAIQAPGLCSMLR